MIPLSYSILLALTVLVLARRFRGRTVEGLIRNPPAGSDLNIVVSTLSYLEHELLKHRIPVVRSLLAKPLWNQDDHLLMGRTVGRGESSLVGEYQRYLDGIQRGAGRTLVNFERDRAFHLASKDIQVIQRAAERWSRGDERSIPSQQEREPIEGACDWLAGPFRKYLLELSRSVFRCPITKGGLLYSARRGVLEAGTDAQLTADEPPRACFARVLAADLDVAIRNVVRNAAQLAVSEGTARRIHLDVAETIDDTGEENVLIRVHDTNPNLLTRSQIYGRDVKRGLGLVTAALTRNQGAVSCVPSDREGFTKALQIRLSASLHRPDAEALAVSRARLSTYLIPGLLILLHAVGLFALVIPYALDRPVLLDSLWLPQGCTHTPTTESAIASICCGLITSGGELRREPIELRLPGEPMGQLEIDLEGAACPRVDFERPSRLVIDLNSCIDEGTFEPRFTLRFSSLWTRADSRLEVRIQATRDRLVATLETALSQGDLQTARHLAVQLSRQTNPSQSPQESAEVAYFNGLTALMEGFVQISQREGQAVPRDGRLCTLIEEVQRSAHQVSQSTADLWAPQADLWRVRVDFLVALDHLWLSGSYQRAAQLLRTISTGENQRGPLQSARFYLALLGGEGRGGVTQGQVVEALQRMALTYERPAPSLDSDRSAFMVELVGASALFGQAQWIPVPEALCAFRANYPDVALPSALELKLAQICALGELDPISDRYIRWAGRHLRRWQAPVSCPVPAD